MTHPLNILVIAPYAPPKNTAEAIQVWRIMKELDKHATGRLVKITPNSGSSWEQYDASLELHLQHFDTQLLSLPAHRFTSAVFNSHHMARFHVPDASMWIKWMTNHILRKLTVKPDIIYSRSSPMSAALLSARLKEKLGIPWVMHLSDPWADSLYKTYNPRDAAYEAECFAKADLTALTTAIQADYYRQKYPDCAHKIFVSPNVMPERVERAPDLALDGKLHIVFAGRLYGSRSPKPLIEALDILRKERPEILARLRIDFYGNVQAEAMELLLRAPDVLHYHGHVPFAEANAAQHAADLVLAIEPGTDHALIRGTLLSKITDCMAQGQRLLALTPEGSETERFCKEGYGWAVSPNKPRELSERLVELVASVYRLRYAEPKEPEQFYAVTPVVQDLLHHMHGLLVKEVAA